MGGFWFGGVGIHKGENIEKVHLDFWFKKTSCNIIIYAEFGRFLLKVVRVFNVIKLLNTDNCILKRCYEQMYELAELHNCNNWAILVKNELTKLRFNYNYLWQNQSANVKFLPLVKQKINDQVQQDILLRQMSVSSK